MTNSFEERKNEINMKECQKATLLKNIRYSPNRTGKSSNSYSSTRKSIREEQNAIMNKLHTMLEAELEFKHKLAHLRRIGDRGI